MGRWAISDGKIKPVIEIALKSCLKKLQSPLFNLSQILVRETVVESVCNFILALTDTESMPLT